MDNSWTDEATRELEIELRRLDLDVETKGMEANLAQKAYEAAQAEQATVRRMLEWTRRRREQAFLPVPTKAAQAVVPDVGGVDIDFDFTPAPAAISIGSLSAATKVRAVTTADIDRPSDTEPPAQTDLAVGVLRRHQREMSTVEIREELEQAGYVYTQTQIRAALKYLAKKKNPPVVALGPGQWRLSDSLMVGIPFADPEDAPVLSGIGASP